MMGGFGWFIVYGGLIRSNDKRGFKHGFTKKKTRFRRIYLGKWKLNQLNMEKWIVNNSALKRDSVVYP